ncbi:hypothetical protein TNCV_893331 [Trichonephila clavipes]|nr:hypothetical protein TNCV_893331 [Trichonephila clavipes]
MNSTAGGVAEGERGKLTYRKLMLFFIFRQTCVEVSEGKVSFICCSVDFEGVYRSLELLCDDDKLFDVSGDVLESLAVGFLGSSESC